MVTCLTSATVTLLYGIQFGETKTKKWLFSLTVSIINDVFVAQPLKVLAVAIAFAYIVKKPLKERNSNHEAIPHEGFESVTRDDLELEAPDPSLCTATDFMKTERKKREKNKFMYSLLKTLCSYFIFIILVLILAYSQRDTNAYYLTSVQENTFTGEGFHQVRKLEVCVGGRGVVGCGCDRNKMQRHPLLTSLLFHFAQLL